MQRWKNSRERLPVSILIGVITLVTLIQWAFGLARWMMEPREVVNAWESAISGNLDGAVFQVLATTLTAAFLHANVGHLLGNALFIWIFAAAVCELCGWRWMGVVFVLTAIGGSLGQIALDPSSQIATLGASGALMGLEGFYFGMVVQRTRPDVHIWPMARPMGASELAAVAVVAVVFDVMGIVGEGEGIAYGAHLGGLASGFLLSFIRRG